MDSATKVILDSVGECLKGFKGDINDTIREIEQRLEDNAPQFAIAEVEARKAAVVNYCRDFTSRKSVVLKESIPGVHLKALDRD